MASFCWLGKISENRWSCWGIKGGGWAGTDLVGETEDVIELSD